MESNLGERLPLVSARQRQTNKEKCGGGESNRLRRRKNIFIRPRCVVTSGMEEAVSQVIERVQRRKILLIAIFRLRFSSSCASRTASKARQSEN